METKWQILIKKSPRAEKFDIGDTVCFFVSEYRDDGKVFKKKRKIFHI